MVLGSASLTAKVPYKLSYDANGGEGATPDEASFMKGAPVTVAGHGELNKGKAEFTGWNTQADGNGTSYAAGQEVTFDADTTLYAQWKEAPASDSAAPAKTMTASKLPPTGKLAATGSNIPYLFKAAAFALLVGSGIAVFSKLARRRRE